VAYDLISKGECGLGLEKAKNPCSKIYGILTTATAFDANSSSLVSTTKYAMLVRT
jgi:hypothetical protein